MPQLDNNTFIYQYVGIIVLLLSVYFILSYLVLPVLLRSTLVRTILLNRVAATKEQLSNGAHLQLTSIGVKSRNLTFLDKIVYSVTQLLSALTKSSTSSALTQTAPSALLSTSRITETNFIAYLVLFLQIDDSTNE